MLIIITICIVLIKYIYIYIYRVGTKVTKWLQIIIKNGYNIYNLTIYSS